MTATRLKNNLMRNPGLEGNMIHHHKMYFLNITKIHEKSDKRCKKHLKRHKLTEII